MLFQNNLILTKKVKFLTISLLFYLFGFAFFQKALAHCPLCVAGAGMGLVLSRYLGVDDTISGIWMGAFLGSMSFWLANKISKKYVPLQKQIIYFLIFALTVWSFYAFGLVGLYSPKLFGFPKLVLGIGVGGSVFYLADFLDNLIIKRLGKVLFPYQRIVVSLASILAASLFFLIYLNFIY